jgi:hypothetical protein
VERAVEARSEAKERDEMAIELVPLCNVRAQLKPPIEVGPAAFGSRMIFEVASIELEGDRLRAAMEGAASADWLLVGPAGEASLDVRATVRTHDGAILYASYYGRCTFTGTFPVTIYVAPRFETSDERYRWLNYVQAVGKGVVDEKLGLDYEWYEMR